MTNYIKVVGLGGWLARNSSSLAALRITLEGAQKAGAVTQLLDVRQPNLPMHDPAEKDPPDSVRQFCEAVENSHG